MPMMHIQVSVHAACACPCCMCMYMLYIHFHGEMSMPMLHVHVHVACPFSCCTECPCCMSMTILYMCTGTDMGMNTDTDPRSRKWTQTWTKKWTRIWTRKRARTPSMDMDIGMYRKYVLTRQCNYEFSHCYELSRDYETYPYLLTLLRFRWTMRLKEIKNLFGLIVNQCASFESDFDSR
jgi:hypothetical protein